MYLKPISDFKNPRDLIIDISNLNKQLPDNLRNPMAVELTKTSVAVCIIDISFRVSPQITFHVICSITSN